MKSMEESFGSADRELSVVQETVNYSLANLKSVLVGIAQSNITQDFLKDIINDATRFLEVFKNSEATIRPILTVFEKLVSLVVSLSEALGGVGTILTGFALKNAVSGGGIFKFIASDAANARYEVAFLGKTFKEWKAEWAAFNPVNVSIRKQETESLQRFAKSLTKVGNDGKWATTITESFAQNVSGLSAQSQITGKQIANLGAQLRAGGMSLTEYNAQVQALIASEVEATAASRAMAIGMNLLLQALPVIAISLLVTAITKYKQKLEEVRKAQDEAAESAKENNQQIEELYSKYRKLSEEVKTNDAVKEDLQSTTSELLKLLGVEEDQIDTLTDKYQGLDNAINQAALDALKANQGDLGIDVENKRNDLLKKFGGIGNLNKDRINSDTMTSDISAVIEQIITDMGLADVMQKTNEFLDEGVNYNDLNLALDVKYDTKSINGIRDLYETYQQLMRNIENELGSEAFTNPFYTAIQQRANDIKTELEAYNDSLEAYDNGIARQIILEKELADGIPKTTEAFATWRKELIETAKANNSWYEESDIENSINKALRSMTEFSDYMSTTSGQVVDFSITPNFIISQEDITASLDSLKENIDDILKNTNLFDKAIESLKKGDSISFDDMMKLVGVDPTLSDKFKQTADGYKATLDDLSTARTNYVQSTSDSISESIKNNKTFAWQIQQNIRDLKSQRNELSKHISSANDVQILKDYDAQIEYQEGLLQTAQQTISESALYQTELNKTYADGELALEDYADITKDLADKESTLDSIHKEVNSDGYISVSTYQKLIAYGEDYAGIVEVENGQLTISERAYKNLVTQKYKDQIATLELAKAEDIRRLSLMASLHYSQEEIDALREDIRTKQALINDANKSLNLWENYTPSDNTTKKQYSQELQLLKDQLNDRVITYEQFLQRWQALNDKYHKMSEEEGGISDYEYNQNNRDIIEERKKAYEQEKKDLQELYEAGKLSLDEYNIKVDASLNKWLGGYAQLSDDFKEQTKDNAEFAKTHFFDAMDRELEKLSDEYDKTGDKSLLDKRESIIRNGLAQTDAKLKGLYAKGLTDSNDEVQYWLDKQKKYNSDLDNILNERTDIIKDNIDKQIEAIDKEIEKSGDADDAKLLSKVSVYEQGKTDLQSQINDYIARGYSENSDEVKALQKQIEEYDKDILDVYKSIGDNIEKSMNDQIKTIDREIKQTGDLGKYQIKLNILADTKQQYLDLIEEFKKLGYDANSDVVKDLLEKVTELDDEIYEVSKERVDAQISAYEDVMSLETEQLEKYKKEQDKIFDEKLKALEEEKKALEKQTKELDKQKELEEKKKAILDAQRGIYNSLKMVYTGNGGWSIKPSQESLDALKKAEEDLKGSAEKQKLEDIETKIDDIKEQKEKFDDKLDDKLDKIEENTKDFKDTMEKTYKVYSELDYAFLQTMFKDDPDALATFKDKYDEIVNKYDVKYGEQTQATEQQAEATKEQTKATDKVTESAENASEALDSVTKSAKKYSKGKGTLKDQAEFNSLAKEMQKEFGLGNVDLTKRPFVSGDKMRKAGYDVDANGTSTVYSGTEFLWQGDEESGKYVAVHYTPILPNGEVLTDKEMRDYLYNVLEGSQDILKADNKGLVLKVDTDLNLSEKDMKSLETGKLTKHMKDVLALTDEWDVALHEIQEEWMNMYFKVYGNPNDKAIDLKGGKNYTGLLGFVQSFLNGNKSITSLATDMSAVNQLGSSTKMMSAQNINSNNFAPVITNNFTITTPNGNAEEIKSAVNDIVENKILQGLRAFHDGYYQQSMKERFGH